MNNLSRDPLLQLIKPASQDIRAIMLCGGEATRWQDHLGVKKHFVDIDGVPLLVDTVKKLSRRGVTDLVIVARDESYKLPLAELLIIPAQQVENPQQKLLSSQSKWNASGTTLLIFGDVYFSEMASDELVSTKGEGIEFFGRLHASRITGCRHGEIFAISFNNNSIPDILAAISGVPVDAALAKRPTGWLVYDYLADRSAKGELQFARGVVFHHIDDFTEDFDYGKDYDLWKASRISKVISRYNPDRKIGVWRKRARFALALGLLVGGSLGGLLGHMLT